MSSKDLLHRCTTKVDILVRQRSHAGHHSLNFHDLRSECMIKMWEVLSDCKSKNLSDKHTLSIVGTCVGNLITDLRRSHKLTAARGSPTISMSAIANDSGQEWTPPDDMSRWLSGSEYGTQDDRDQAEYVARLSKLVRERTTDEEWRVYSLMLVLDNHSPKDASKVLDIGERRARTLMGHVSEKVDQVMRILDPSLNKVNPHRRSSPGWYFHKAVTRLVRSGKTVVSYDVLVREMKKLGASRVTLKTVNWLAPMYDDELRDEPAFERFVPWYGSLSVVVDGNGDRSVRVADASCFLEVA